MKSKFLLSACLILLLLQPRSLWAVDACTIWEIKYANACSSSGTPPFMVTLYGSVISGPQPSGTVFTWNFGDGSPTETYTSHYPQVLNHIYAAGGTYTVSLTYTEPSCSTVTVYKTVQVAPVTLNFTVPSATAFQGTPFLLTFGTSDPSYNLSYTLKINSGTAFPVTSPYLLTPSSTGTYNMVLTGYVEGCSLTKTVVVNIICPTCAKTGISVVSPVCVGSPTHFIDSVANCTGLGAGGTNQLVYTWDYGDGTTSTGFAPDHIYTSPGTYTVKLTYQFVGEYVTEGACTVYPGGSTVVVVGTCPPPPCEDCVGSFAPTAGNYILGTWVKQANGENLITYDKAGVKVTCVTPTGPVVSGPFYPSATGKIIEGWQRIEQQFSVPVNTSQIKIQLVNTGTSDAYFDDIRVHPLDGNMKSYVYDPITLRLMAELDENNYATLYEYDEEGALIRVKKETERGIMTIKESRNNSSKQ